MTVCAHSCKAIGWDGGKVQETAGRRVETLKMLATAKVFVATMMMGTMAIVVAVIVHLAIAAGIDAATNLVDAEQASIVLEDVRRFGVALYLFGIAFGLGTIIKVL